ncbi:MAG: substrate-binding domain-containing protein [Lentisphaeria bacterium]|nr:substrate-binding domain-containing protein [Lentisphaeria bacterium]
MKNEILADIKSGKYPENTPLPAVNVIADSAGISVRTAYLAVQELVKDGVCFRRPKKGTFVGGPENLVRHAVCAVWTEYSEKTPFDYPLSSVFYCGILQGCGRFGITPVLVSGSPEEVIRRYDRSREFDFKGVLVLDSGKFDAAVELARKFPEKRFFFVNYVMEKINDLPPNMTAVVDDGYRGAYRMIEHLISLQCNDFVIFNVDLDPGDRTYCDRLRGALAALREYSVPVEAKDVLRRDRFKQEEWAFLAMTRLLRSGRRPQAVFCVNDLLAVGVCRALEAEKVTGVAVAGYDNLYPHFSEQWGFDTMQVPYSQMVIESLRLLSSDGESPERVIKLRSELVERKGK